MTLEQKFTTLAAQLVFKELLQTAKLMATSPAKASEALPIIEDKLISFLSATTDASTTQKVEAASLFTTGIRNLIAPGDKVSARSQENSYEF